MTFLGDRISEIAERRDRTGGHQPDGHRDRNARELRPSKWCKRPSPELKASIDLRNPEAAKVPTMAIRMNALLRWPTTASPPKDALDNVQTALPGTTIGQTYVGAQTVDVVVILPPEEARPDRASSQTCWSAIRRPRRVQLRNVASIGSDRRALHHSARGRAAARQCELQRRARPPFVAGYRRRGERPRR